ncbi:hypothetical protein BDN67DRAFT_139782 [Paxillus ammoniavirescens]|nr:hypothetical protein BDN67DRAFT_139782 [Paxillus ammoniavirescens]
MGSEDSTIWKATRPVYPTMEAEGHKCTKVEVKLSENVALHEFMRLAEIEWYKLAPSRLRWFEGAGGSGLGVGEIDAKDFIPSRGVLRRFCFLFNFWEVSRAY